MPLHVSRSMCSLSKLYYTASGTVTPIGGRPVRRLREDCTSTQVERGLQSSLNLRTGRPPIGVMIPEAV
jgi:hypothetical protein